MTREQIAYREQLVRLGFDRAYANELAKKDRVAK